MTPLQLGPQVQSVSCATPPHYVNRDAVLSALKRLWSEHPDHEGRSVDLARVETIYRSVGVDGRHFTVPLASFLERRSFAQRNEVWVEAALDIGERAIRGALARAGLEPVDVDHVFFVTVTGIATPSIDAKLVNRLGLRPDVKRTPIFGLGCVAGAAGTARTADYLRAFPEQVAVLLSVELCSLTFLADDMSMANAVASALFGDGGAAVVLAGAARREVPGPRIVATRSVFYPETEDVMGWRVVDGGFQILLSGAVPRLARERIRSDVDDFLAAQRLSRSDVKHWVSHTGGPKILTAFEQALELAPGALSRSWNSLRRFGNLSSSSVLFVLADLLAEESASPGDYGLMLAMGPGFCSELVLLQW